MSDFLTLSCPSCGAQLQITPDLDRFACSHCGHQHIVRRAGGVVSLAPILDQVAGVRAGVDRTASELAIPRLEKELEKLVETRAAIIAESDRLAAHTTEVRRISGSNSVKLSLVGFVAGLCAIPTFISMFGSDQAMFDLMFFGSAAIAVGAFVIASRYRTATRQAKQRLPDIEADRASKLSDLEHQESRIVQSLNEHKRIVSE